MSNKQDGTMPETPVINESSVISFVDDEGREVDFYILEETRVNGKNYILVADTMDEDKEAEAMILIDKSDENAKEALYEIVDNEEELYAVSKIFSELMDDTNIELSVDE